MCWAHDPDTTAGSHADFKVMHDASAELIGPRITRSKCTLGIYCTIKLDGFRMMESSKLIALSQGTCGCTEGPGCVLANIGPEELVNASQVVRYYIKMVAVQKNFDGSETRIETEDELSSYGVYEFHQAPQPTQF